MEKQFPTSLLNCVPYVLTCQRALSAYVPIYLACLHANVPTCLTCIMCLECLRVLCAYMLMCLACLRAHMTCLACLCAQAPTCHACLRAHMSCMQTCLACSSAITTNNKNEFSITSFPYIFVIVLCFFPMK